MTRKNLKIIMQIKNFSLIKIANQLKVSTTVVYEVVNGAKSSKRIEAALEEAFSLPIEKIRKAWNDKGAPEITPEIKKAFNELGVSVPA